MGFLPIAIGTWIWRLESVDEDDIILELVLYQPEAATCNRGT